MRFPSRRRQRAPETAVGNIRGPDGTWYGPRTTGAGATGTALARMDAEARAITSVPWDVGGPLGSTALDQSTALSLASVYSATDLLATSVATLPIKGYRRVGDQRRAMSTLPPLFATLVAEGRLVTWLRQCMTSLLLRGNAVGLVTSRDRFEYPTSIEWLCLDHVQVMDQATSGVGSYMDPVWYWLGAKVSTEDIIHIPWYVVPERVLGLSPLAAFASTIGVGLSAQSYGADWFNSGGFPPGTFQNSEQQITQVEATEISNRLTAAMRARRPLVFGRDWTYTPVTVPPEEAQFVATMQLTATQIASIYHVPPEWIGGTTGQGLHYSTAEQDMIQMVTLGVRPYVELLECVFYALMPPPQYIRFNLDSLIRADLKTRHEVYEIDAHIGLRTVDEMRAQEDWEPLPPQGDDANPADLAEMVRKLYLGTNVFLTPDETRELLNRAGGKLPIPGDITPPIPAPPPAPVAPDAAPAVNGSRAWRVPV